MVGLIIWAERFIPKYAGYSLDFIALVLTAFVFRYGENYLRELQSSHELFFVLIVPFAVCTILAWYSLKNADIEIVRIHARVINAETNDTLHGAEVSCLSKPSVRWETDKKGQLHIELANVSRKQSLIFYIDLDGFRDGSFSIEPDQIKSEIVLTEDIRLSPVTLSQK